MILSFSVENFRSVHERQSLIFEATKDDSLAHSNVIESNGHRVLKCSALYGANASGKSTILDAMITMRKIVMTSASENLEESTLPAAPFALHVDTPIAPTEFEVEILIGEIRYRYGFSFDRKKIVEEWLFQKQAGIKEVKLFSRDEGGIQPNAKKFPEGKQFVAKTRSNVLFLRTCAEWNAKIPAQIVEWFRRFRSVSGINEIGFYEFTAERLQNVAQQESLLRLAQKADFNITLLASEIEKITPDLLPKDMPAKLKSQLIREVNHRAEIKTGHSVFDDQGQIAAEVHFDLRNDESQGTCKFIALSGPLEHTLEEGSILIIDEFEARLHPNLTKAILQWFLGPANDKGAQLIIATHDTGLMVPELLRRDQVWFCNKSDKGATSLYCLDEFDSNKVRPNTRFDRQYLQGIFGAVPNIALNEI